MLSTYCRRCGEHYKIVGGKPVAASTPTLNSERGIVTTRDLNTTSSQTSTKETAETRNQSTPLVSRNELSFRPNGTSTTLCQRDTELECIDCGHIHSVSENASSSLCPRCGSYTSLKNYDIREPWTRQIRTRGDVLIHEKGNFSGASITCRDLTIEGEFDGTISCIGDLIIRKSCRILGKVKCRHLIVENKAKVECENAIQTKEATVDGSIHADVTCAGRLELVSKASLLGDINIAKLVINEGATHQGRVSMITLPLS